LSRKRRNGMNPVQYHTTGLMGRTILFEKYWSKLWHFEHTDDRYFSIQNCSHSKYTNSET
jgi:hypothetical protein